MQTLLMFPGQGSQALGMLADFDSHPFTKSLLEQTNDALGRDLTSLMASGAKADTLQDTRNAQPALLAIGYIAAAYLIQQSGKTLPQLATLVAGHSVGEYTAAAVSGALDFTSALQLVQTRANAMAEAVPAGQGGMSAILGLNAEQIQRAITGIQGVYLANDNAPGQLIISGQLAALERAEVACKEAAARRVVRLNVSGPFHTPAMQPAADAVKAFLTSHPVQTPVVPLVMNATAEPTTAPQQVAINLVAQITSPVRWRESMMLAAGQGVTTALEVGSGSVLSGIAPRCDARLSAQSLGSRAAIDAWLQANL